MNLTCVLWLKTWCKAFDQGKPKICHFSIKDHNSDKVREIDSCR